MILVDRRKGSRELFPLLERGGLPVELDTLDFADFAFIGRGIGGAPLLIGVEFKNLADLIQSMTTERLQGYQLPGLLRMYDPDLTGQRVYLLVEGTWKTDQQGRLLRCGKKGQMVPMEGAPPASALRRRLLTLATRAGVTVWLTTSRRDTVAFLADLYRFWTDVDLDQHKSHLAIYSPDVDRALFRNPTVAEQVAVLLPGIGSEKAKAVAERFTSVKALVQATEKDWMSIEGIGVKIARNAIATLCHGGSEV